MKPTRNAPAAEQKSATSPSAEAQAQQGVDQAVAASDEAMRAELSRTADVGSAMDGQTALDAVAQADQTLATTLAQANAGEAAATHALGSTADEQDPAVQAAQQLAEQAMAEATRSTSES